MALAFLALKDIPNGTLPLDVTDDLTSTVPVTTDAGVVKNITLPELGAYLLKDGMVLNDERTAGPVEVVHLDAAFCTVLNLQQASTAVSFDGTESMRARYLILVQGTGNNAVVLNGAVRLDAVAIDTVVDVADIFQINTLAGRIALTHIGKVTDWSTTAP